MEPQGTWFKFYHEWSHDPKIQTLSEADQRRHVMMMALHCKGESFDPEKYAWAMRVTKEELDATLARLRAAGVRFDAQGNLASWKARQGMSERQRQRKSRQKRITKTDVSRDGHVTVTSPSRACHTPDPDADPDAEKKKNPLPPTPAPVGSGEVSALPGMTTPKKAKKDRGYTAEEHNAIDVAKAYWREVCLKLNTPAKMGGACDEHIVRYCKRPDGGKDRLLEALHRLNDHLPRREMWDRPWWNLEWIVRDKASLQAGGRPVNRPAEILEGAWDEKQPGSTEEYINCDVCHGIIGSSCTCKGDETAA